MNIKLIILLIGLFLFTIGVINNINENVKVKYIYKLLPRNIYGEILFSSPMPDFDGKNKLESPTYVLGDNDDYDSLFTQKNICDKDNCDDDFKPFYPFDEGMP